VRGGSGSATSAFRHAKLGEGDWEVGLTVGERRRAASLQGDALVRELQNPRR